MVRAASFKTGQVCEQYAFAAPDCCEVNRYLTVDRDVAAWLSNHKLSGFEVHHIFGRPAPIERNHWCNLIRIERAAHAFCHSLNPTAGRLVCLYAKMKRHQSEMLLYPDRETMSDRLHWSVEAMDLVVTPKRSFVGVVELLTAHCRGTTFEGYGEELLTYLGA